MRHPSYALAGGGVLLLLLLGGAGAQDEPVFSGPQVGEKLVPFTVTGVYDDEAGKPLDWITQAAGKPMLLIFVHPPVTRPSAAVTRVLANYAHTRKDGLFAGVVWLADDAAVAEQFLKQARGSLNVPVPLAVSVDGAEGPGAYGLNRKMGLTILVAKENRVTANFALVQPSLTEVPKILGEVVKLIGGEVPPLEQLVPQPGMMKKQGEVDPAAFRELLAPVIRKESEPAAVEQAAAAVEEYVKDNEARQRELGRIAHTIVASGRISNYGTPQAQEILRRWAEKYGKSQQ
ncbi:MAG: hypothetical protein HY000_07910 [Planctomycetes bacterium]|nr:hypothetical protein [Planctomycetota bacterium]